MKERKLKMTPAAFAAAANGDLDNFFMAATPGGIEAQEAAGQATFVAQESLPKRIMDITREQLEALGFQFGEDLDDLFVTARLPKGWKKEAAPDHSMWSYLIDENGKRRASIFYKAAFYDRSAFMRWDMP